MSISSIFVEREAFKSLGIGIPELPLDEPLHMPSLGSVVVLAGPNGGGKSRLLRMVPLLVNAHLSLERREQLSQERSGLEDNVTTWNAAIAQMSSPDSPPADAKALADARDKLNTNIQNLETLSNRLRMTELLELSSGQLPAVVHFVPTVASLESPADVTDNVVNDRAGRMSALGSEMANANAPAYLRGVLRAATIARADNDGSAKGTAALQDERDLLQLLAQVLGTKAVPGLDSSLNLEVKGVALKLDRLSPGQQVLLQFACMLHAQGTGLADCIVLMDEPENHLHPQVMLEVVDSIVRCIGKGQLWVATHSVPLVAHLASRDTSCLWLVQDGKVKSAKRAPSDVLYSLMGGAAGTSQLREFLRLPEQYATLRFLAQCLEPPAVVGADIKDPQTNQIRAIVRDLADKLQRPLRLLDFGAGKARLLRTLAEGDADLSSWLDYYAFDVDSDNETERLTEISRQYPNPEKRSLNKKSIDAASIDEGTVDIAVMCNVLHEIAPDEWRNWFGEKGRLTALLQKDGYLLVVEDFGIPIGERAHQYGFLLLDEPELVKLFDIKTADRDARKFVRSTPEDERFKDRLVAHLVEAACVERFTADTQKAAIGMLHKRMSEHLKQMLSQGGGDRSAQIGRDYARTAQLQANSSLWLSEHP